jgi:hypothetical protein
MIIVFSKINGAAANIRYEDDSYNLAGNEVKADLSDTLPTANELAVKYGLVSLSLVSDQIAAIDAHIQQQIQTLDYDDIGQVALCAGGGEHEVEALRVRDWIGKCWDIQNNIKTGKVTLPSVDDAINVLPVFDI